MELGAGTWGGTNRGSSCKVLTVSQAIRTMCFINCITYRALKLCPLPSVALEDVIKTDVCTCELLASGFARAGYRASFAITTAVALRCVAIELVELSLEAVFSAHQA